MHLLYIFWLFLFVLARQVCIVVVLQCYNFSNKIDKRKNAKEYDPHPLELGQRVLFLFRGVVIYSSMEFAIEFHLVKCVLLITRSCVHVYCRRE